MIDRVFKSKVGWWYHLALFILIACTVLTFVKGQSVIAMIVLLLMCMLTIHMLLTTWYKITASGELIAHCSIFPEKRIPIKEITAIEATVMPVSSYALSLDRIIIYKGEAQWLLISPVNKKEFVRLLRQFNPEIEVKDSLIG